MQINYVKEIIEEIKIHDHRLITRKNVATTNT